jgi:hypothetical protein
MGTGWASTIAIAQDAARLTVEYTFFARGDMQPPMRFTYPLDGSETTNTVMMGRGMQAQRSRAKWDADKLVITTIHTFIDPATGKSMPVTETRTLSLESPTSLLVDTTREGVMGAPATSTKVTYRKLQQ